MAKSANVIGSTNDNENDHERMYEYVCKLEDDIVYECENVSEVPE